MATMNQSTFKKASIYRILDAFRAGRLALASVQLRRMVYEARYDKLTPEGRQEFAAKLRIFP